MSDTGFVYYMQCAETLRIKIGYSVDPERRVGAFSTGPTAVRLLCYEPGDVALEREMQRRFWHALVTTNGSREWFYPVPPLVEHVRGLGGDPDTTGARIPGAVVGHYRAEAMRDELMVEKRSLHYDRRRIMEATRQMEGLVQDVLELRSRSHTRKTYRHGNDWPSGGFFDDVRNVRAWLRPALEERRAEQVRGMLSVVDYEPREAA